MTRKVVATYGPLAPTVHYEVEERREGRTWSTILDYPADLSKHATKKTWIEYQEAARFAREWSERYRTVATRVVEVKD